MLAQAGCVAAAVLLCAAGVAHADLRRTPGGLLFDPEKDRETHLLSRSMSGGFPNGPSRNGVFSQDRQLATVAAFESLASDIVPGDTNGASDVFTVYRARPYSKDGEPWHPARTVLASRGMGGLPANGASYRPDVGGGQLHKPGCIAFVSAASNLVPGDTNGKPDAFVRFLRTGRIVRVSVNARRQQSNGATYDVRVDGDCERVAFTSDATNLALTSTRKRLWKSARTSSPPAGTKQVYVRIIGRLGDNARLKGLTFLASASRRGTAGNGNSYDVAFARSAGGCPRRCGDFAGESVYFTSEASNLARGDGNGYADVYKRSFTRRFKRLRYPRIRGVGKLRMRTRLVSVNRRGRAGNGPSGQPATHDTGRYVAFTTLASDILQGDHNGVADVARADTSRRRPRVDWVSRSAAVREPGNGASANPSMARPGSPVFFDSEANNFQPRPPSHPGVYSDRNAVRDMFFWNVVSKNVSLQSRDSSNEILNLPSSFTMARPAELSAPSENPATSYYGNYVLFETANPVVDRPLARKSFPSLLGDALLAANVSRQRPELRQVYLRYIGPR
jgi:hypothetical protein